MPQQARQAVQAMPRIAHLSDIHMLDDTRSDRVRARRLRPQHALRQHRAPARPRAAKKKLQTGLRAARRAGADHFVISGDLTEMGTPAQYEALAETLHGSGVEPWRITLVPGNHDAYDSPTAWRDAIDGVLRPWAPTSARNAGAVVDIGRVCILPLDVACHQPVTRSAGLIDDAAIDAIERRVLDTAFRGKPIVLVQHHPPFERSSVMQWIDGLRGWGRLMNLIERFPAVHAMHGHLHHMVSRVVGLGRDRVFGAPAIVDDPVDKPRVRLYDVHGETLESVGLA